MPLIALPPPEQRRLERLAKRAGRSPKAMLKFVLRDGFDACEEDVRENLAADAEFAAGRSVAHKDSMIRARAVIAAHSRRHKQAA
jgi:predicted transcriptional regulator